ncbi:MAG: long-chain fatty acid--CoA ligase [Planctomycetes bacterium]|nr:long-chain fatty acid--CoA ligase [Planctomycetota bacterium]
MPPTNTAPLWRGRSIYHAFSENAARFPKAVAWWEHASAGTPTDSSGSSSNTVPESALHQGFNASPQSYWRSWTWQELEEYVHRTGTWMIQSGIGPGDRVANLEPNGIDWAVVDLACAAVGAIHAPLDRRLPLDTLSETIQRLEPKWVFPTSLFADLKREAYPQLASRFRGLSPISQLRTLSDSPSESMLHAWNQAVRDEQTACILFTSGTSGLPKGVMLSHANLMSNAMAKLDAMPQSHEDLRLNFLPFAHAYARTCELSAWAIAGGALASVHSIADVIEFAPTLQPTLINGVPAFYESLHQRWQTRGCSLDVLQAMLGNKIRRLASGGAPLQAATRAAFAAVGLPIFQGYGMTEASPVVCSNREGNAGDSPTLDGVGPPVLNVEIRIDSESRLWVRGPGVMQGYWRDAPATQQRLIDGWLDTGDSASPLQARSFSESTSDPNANPSAGRHPASLQIHGRLDDVQILSNGYKFSPEPIERTLREQGVCDRCVLVGNGKRYPTLIVQRNHGSGAVQPEDLLRDARSATSQFPPYAQPRAVIITADPWTTENGLLHWKGGIRRTEIEKRYHQHPTSATC